MKVGKTIIPNNNGSTDRKLTELTQQRREKQGHKKDSKTIFAGGLNGNQDLITNKKALGNKQAIKTILNTFTKEMKVDDGINKLKNKQEEFLGNIKDFKDKIKSVQDMKADIQKAYNVSEDSDEQKDTELLIKAQNSSGDLTKEEMERLKNIGPLTDYQKEILEVNKMETDWTKRMESASMGITSIDQAITGISLERLKSNPVLEAKKQAEAILENTSKEVAGLLLDEAVENTDKKIEDNDKNSDSEIDNTQPKTEEEKPKAEDKSKADDNSIEDLSTKHEKLLREIKKQAQKDNLSLEDLKGLIVDAQS